MFARVPHPAFSLHPLVAEARRRARQRRVLILVLALALAASGAGLVFGGLALSRATSTRGPYEPAMLVVPSGMPVTAVTADALASVSASSGGAAWIVGSVAWRWDGRAWRSAPVPQEPLESVAAVGADDAWAIDAAGAIERWDGTRWGVVYGFGSGGSPLATISAVGSADVWAAGPANRYALDRRHGAGRALLVHWDGVAWHTQALPWSGSSLELENVVATGHRHVWVVGSRPSANSDSVPRAAFWNGTRWRVVPAPFGLRDPMFGFSASAWNDAWAVGSYRAGSVSRSIAAHWDGRTWRVVPVPQAPGYNASEIDDVVDLGPGDAWAVGLSNRSGTGFTSTPVPTFYRWDGGAWRLMPGPRPSLGWSGPAITAVGGTAWAIGTCGTDNVIFRWAHGNWVVAKHPPDQHWRFRVPGQSRMPSGCTRSG